MVVSGIAIHSDGVESDEGFHDRNFLIVPDTGRVGSGVGHSDMDFHSIPVVGNVYVGEGRIMTEPLACDLEFGPHEHDKDMGCEWIAIEMQHSSSYDPMDDIPWGTPDSWIPDNPDENGMRMSDFI